MLFRSIHPLSVSGITTAQMASGLHLVFFLCFISGLPTGETASLANNLEVPVPGCPPKWTRFGSRCFIFENRHVTMGDAENHCLSLGGNLASIHNVEEASFIRDLIQMGSGSFLQTWIGCHDGIKKGQWMWTDGSRFDYQSWGPGEPNNHWGGQQCVEILWDGRFWNDLPCYYSRPFVCTKDL